MMIKKNNTIKSILVIMILTLSVLYSNAFGADYTNIKISPENIGVFKENKTQQFTAYGLSSSNTWNDITNNVDWYIEENGFDGQPSAENTVSIEQNGVATALSTWGRVNVSICYPKGCKSSVVPPKPPTPAPPTIKECLPSVYYLLLNKQCRELKTYAMPSNCRSPLLMGIEVEQEEIPPSPESVPIQASATTSMTVMDVSSWRAPLASDKVLPDMPVRTLITYVSIIPNRITWVWKNGFDGLLWAFYSEDGNKTYKGWGWDYVTERHTLKTLGNGYPRGWVGTGIASCGKCTGYPQRTTVYFTQTY